MERNSDGGFDVADFMKWRLDRRHLLGAAGLATAGGLLSACTGGQSVGQSGGGTSSGHSIVPTPREKTVIIDQGPFSVYNSFNPLIPNGEQYQAGVAQLAKEYLFYLNLATGKLIYWQGKSWSYNATFDEMTLKLNPDVKWSDGKPFTSADIEFTVNLMKQNAAQVANGEWTKEVTSMDVPDDATVVFHLNKRDPRFHYNLVCQIISANLLVLPKHVWENQSITTFKNNPPVYTGPYKLQKTIQNLGLFIWEKQANYWNKSTMDPKPQYVVFRNAPQSDQENENFKNAEIDSPAQSTAYDYAKSLQAQGNKNVIITSFVDSDQRAMIVNCDPSRGALADPKFRYAISMLIDRQKVIKSVWPVPTVADTYPWPTYPNTKAWENSALANKYAYIRQYNPTKAGQMLDELGIKKGSGGKRELNGKALSLQVITPQSSSGTQAAEYIVGQLLSQELEKLGISSSIKQLSTAVYNARVAKGQYDIRSEWFGGALLDQYQLYEQMNSKLYYEPIGTNALSGDNMRFKDPEFDTLVDKMADSSPTAASSKPTYDQALEQFFIQQPVITYLQTVYTHVFNTTYWTGWPTNDNLYNVPSDWWGQFMFVIGNLKPAGGH
jgi:peptide/nickel transport system substrate-binding protein